MLFVAQQLTTPEGLFHAFGMGVMRLKHFFAAAAEGMRRILSGHARSQFVAIPANAPCPDKPAL